MQRCETDSYIPEPSMSSNDAQLPIPFVLDESVEADADRANRWSDHRALAVPRKPVESEVAVQHPNTVVKSA